MDLRTYKPKVVMTYALEELMPRLEDKFTRELEDGAFVVTNIFKLPTWVPTEDGVKLSHEQIPYNPEHHLALQKRNFK